MSFEKAFIVKSNSYKNYCTIVLQLAKVNAYNEQLKITNTDINAIDSILSLFDENKPVIQELVKYLKIANIDTDLIVNNKYKVIIENKATKMVTTVSPVRKKLKNINWISVD